MWHYEDKDKRGLTKEDKRGRTFWTKDEKTRGRFEKTRGRTKETGGTASLGSLTVPGWITGDVGGAICGGILYAIDKLI